MATESSLNPKQKSWLTAAFDALGPERVRRGLEAVGHDWNGCFLSIALADELGERTGKRRWLCARALLGECMGFAPWIADEIARLWDRREPAFRLLAREWLEQVSPSSRTGERGLSCSTSSMS